MAGRAAVVIEDAEGIPTGVAVDPAAANIGMGYRLWHVFSPLSESGFSGFRDFQDFKVPFYSQSSFPNAFLIALTTEFLEFVNGVLDGCVA